MAIQTYLLPGFPSRYLQPLVGFRPSLTRPRLDSTWSVADFQLRDCPEQNDVACRRAHQTLCHPFTPDLHRVFEAQLTRVQTCLPRRFSHQQADQIVGEEVDPELFLAHLRRFAAQ